MKLTARLRDRKQVAPPWLAAISWAASRPYQPLMRLSRWQPLDLRTRLNHLANDCHRLDAAYRSRHPWWATTVGSSCGSETPDGYHCHVSGLGHPGPHRTGPVLPLVPYVSYQERERARMAEERR